MKPANHPIRYFQVSNGQLSEQPGEIISETPVTLTVNGEVWLTFMCTPTLLEAMAVGFLFNEGIIEDIDEVVDIHLCDSGDILDVWLNKNVEKPATWRRTSGCTGGITSVEEPEITGPGVVSDGATLTPARISHLVDLLFESQELYRSSGGVHTSALSDGREILAVAEDIGRHNTLDKIAGLMLQNKIDVSRRILITTGRISSEMLQKAFRMDASIVISRTSPSSLSIQLAEARGITLIGYARRNGFRLYTHPERILKSNPSEEMETEPRITQKN